MTRARNKRGMGPLLKEMRTSPVAAVVNGMLGIGGILGGAIVVALNMVRGTMRGPVVHAATQGYLLVLYVCLGAVFLLGGAGFLLFALLQITTSIRVFGRGLVWRRFGKKRVILWLEVEHFGRNDETTPSLTSWSMLLRNGERINFHSGLYSRKEFAETMELIAEQIEENQTEIG